MTEIIAVERVEKEAVWFRLKTMVLDSVSSPITRRVARRPAFRRDPAGWLGPGPCHR